MTGQENRVFPPGALTGADGAFVASSPRPVSADVQMKVEPDAARATREKELKQHRGDEAKSGTSKTVAIVAAAIGLLGCWAWTVAGGGGTWLNNQSYVAQEKLPLNENQGGNERIGENYFLNSLHDFGSLRHGSTGFLDQYDYFQNPGPQGSTDKQIFDLKADGFQKAIKLAAAKNFAELAKLKTQKDFNPDNVELSVSLLRNFSVDHPNLSGVDLMIEYYKMLTAKQGIPFDDKTKTDLTILILK